MSLLNTNLHKHRPHGLAKNTFENLNNAFLKINMQYIKVIQKHYCEKNTIAQINLDKPNCKRPFLNSEIFGF